ncbi:SDR family NAD(P)-dependent oxidoreductase [Nocardiopsis ansamitocini]|uniref:3-oxoacyl-ACP reductase n=1 Tax=Nocardiopsis ansamitocini TaxID=1670832 RepID=A0A9W6P9C5_9ACTN|nr:SDR family oxidoreductase [Nocardiopsis ansamitocini]GLU49378.1 3-oxoacyl-ACP reductase [Nocardiopsis ansamitocini]
MALVTGATGGIGAGAARRLAAEGFFVVVHSRDGRAAGTELAAELDGYHVWADFSDEKNIVALAEQVLARLGRLDVLVNNAGISTVVEHADMAAVSAADWHALLDVNLIAPWTLTSAFLEALRSSPRPGGGSVVNVTSHAGVRPKGASIPYAATKAALNHVTRLLAAALGPHVRVNAVAPGFVETPLTAQWHEARRHWRDTAPMGRTATPADVADIVWALVANSYITGEVLLLDGGFNLR